MEKKRQARARSKLIVTASDNILLPSNPSDLSWPLSHEAFTSVHSAPKLSRTFEFPLNNKGLSIMGRVVHTTRASS